MGPLLLPDMSHSTLRSAALAALVVASTVFAAPAPAANVTTQETQESQGGYNDVILAYDSCDWYADRPPTHPSVTVI